MCLSSLWFRWWEHWGDPSISTEAECLVRELISCGDGWESHTWSPACQEGNNTLFYHQLPSGYQCTAGGTSFVYLFVVFWVFFACHGSFLFILLNHLTQLQQTPRTATSLVFRCFAELFFIPCESLEKSTTCWHFFLIGCVSGGLRQKRCDNECKCTNSMDNWTIIGASLGSSVNICL